MRANIWPLLSTALFTVYLFAAYQWIVIPAVTDGSEYGILFVTVGTLALIFAMPREYRVSYIVFGLAALFWSHVFYQTAGEPWIWRWLLDAGAIAAALVFLWLAGRREIDHLATVAAIVVTLTSAIPLPEMRLWPVFRLIATIPANGFDHVPGSRLVAMERSHGTVSLITANTQPFGVPGRSNHEYVRYSYENGRFIGTPAAPGPWTSSLETFWSRTAALPFYAVQTTVTGSVTQRITVPQFQTPDTFIRLAQPAWAPLESLRMLAKDLSPEESAAGTASGHLSQEPSTASDGFSLLPKPVIVGGAHVPPPPAALGHGKLWVRDGNLILSAPTDGTLLVGHGWFGPGRIPGYLVQGNALELFLLDGHRLVRAGTLSDKEIDGMGGAGILVADIDGDGQDELLINALTARIIKWTEQGWRNLWVSPYTSFRFLGVMPSGDQLAPDIVALAPASLGISDPRVTYLSDFTYDSSTNTLQNKWKVFLDGLAALQGADLDNNGQLDWILSDDQRDVLYIVRRHDIPIGPGMYVISVGLVFLGLATQRLTIRKGGSAVSRYHRPARKGWRWLMLVPLLLSGCGIPTGPLVFDNPASQPVDSPVAGAGRLLSAALRYTGQTAHKFWFQGSLITMIQGRTVTYTFSGEKDVGRQWLIEAQFLDNHTDTAVIGDQTYESQNGGPWQRVPEQPAEPLAGFAALGHALENIPGQKLADETVVGERCSVYRFPLPSAVVLPVPEWVSGVPNGVPWNGHVETTRVLTVWIGESDHLVHRIQWTVTVPYRLLGAVRQTYRMELFDVNTSSMMMPEFQQIQDSIRGKTASHVFSDRSEGGS